MFVLLMLYLWSDIYLFIQVFHILIFIKDISDFQLPKVIYLAWREHVIGVSADWQQCDPQHDDVTDQILFTHSDLWPLSSAYQRPETAESLSASVSLCLF